MGSLRKKGKAPKRLGKEIWGCDKRVHKATAYRREGKLDAA